MAQEHKAKKIHILKFMAFTKTKVMIFVCLKLTVIYLVQHKYEKC